MKTSIKRVVLMVIVAISTLSASAGAFKFGPVVGVNINRFTTSGSELFSADNRSGFTGGLMAKFTVPVIGVGVDLSVMYARRSAEMTISDTQVDKVNYDYIAIPPHLRYDTSLPIVGKFISPALFTGPNFAFRCSKDIVNNFKANKYNVGWDFGVAVTLINHIQIAGAYTLGINKAINYIPTVDVQDSGIKGRTSGWTISAAYLF